MSSFRYILPALAIAGGAAAATCSAATTTLQNQGDASGIASCQTFSGSIAIATNTQDNIDLSGIQEITGSLSSQDAGALTTIQSSSLETIGDTFSLQNMTILSTLNFPRLESVKTIDWNALPALQQLTFTTGVQMASALSIQNTQLTTLEGINLAVVDTVNIVNNNYLTEINMQLGNITNSLILSANGRNVSAMFPNLIWANNMTVSNVSSFNSPSLAAINGSLGFYSNYFSSLSAANLTSVGSSLSVVSCPQLTNASFPLLTQINGGLSIANNTALKSINGFPQLQTIGGALDYYGNFSNASLPSIKDIRGAFNMQSTSDLTSTCNQFQPLAGQNNVIKGTYNCTGEVATPSSGPAGNGGSSTSSGSGSSSSSPSGAASAVQISGMTGVLGVVAVIFGML